MENKYETPVRLRALHLSLNQKKFKRRLVVPTLKLQQLAAMMRGELFVFTPQ